VEEGESPSASLAELYIKQDLFDEAVNIYRKILDSDSTNKTIRQLLEETMALQA
jgi:cytochrome c-type biogenesis protein CcmH/NrfG